MCTLNLATVAAEQQVYHVGSDSVFGHADGIFSSAGVLLPQAFLSCTAYCMTTCALGLCTTCRLLFT